MSHLYMENFEDPIEMVIQFDVFIRR